MKQDDEDNEEQVHAVINLAAVAIALVLGACIAAVIDKLV